MATLSLDGVGKVYGDGTRALRSFSLEVMDGEFVVLVGPSGCGKSTLLRMIAGLEDVTEGEIRINETVVNGLEPRSRDIAMVFQNYALYPHMTVFQNLAFGLKMHRVPRPEVDERVRAISRVLELDDLLFKKPGQLSGGQRQRVAMGRAIVRDPAVFLMDEPLSNLDASLRTQMRAEVARIQHELDATTVYVTHDQIEAMTMGDRVAVLDKGLLQQIDLPQGLYDRPANMFVAGFIGSPSMNFLPARLERRHEQLICDFGSQQLVVPAERASQRPALVTRIGSEVAVGVRPEHVHDGGLASASAGGEGTRLRGMVRLTEALGSELIAHVELAASPASLSPTQAGAVPSRDSVATAGGPVPPAVFIARLEPESSARAGEVVELVVDTRKLHFFDKETRLAID